MQITQGLKLHYCITLLKALKHWIISLHTVGITTSRRLTRIYTTLQDLLTLNQNKVSTGYEIFHLDIHNVNILTRSHCVTVLAQSNCLWLCLERLFCKDEERIPARSIFVWNPEKIPICHDGLCGCCVHHLWADWKQFSIRNIHERAPEAHNTDLASDFGSSRLPLSNWVCPNTVLVSVLFN